MRGEVNFVMSRMSTSKGRQYIIFNSFFMFSEMKQRQYRVDPLVIVPSTSLFTILVGVTTFTSIFVAQRVGNVFYVTVQKESCVPYIWTKKCLRRERLLQL